MSKGIYKNYQVNVGNPFQVKSPVGLNPYTVQHVKLPKEEPENILEEEVYTEKPNVKEIEELLAEAKEEAEMIIKEAHLEAARYIDQISADIEKTRETKYKEAYDKGYNEGLKKAEEQYQNILQEANNIKETALLDYEQEMANLEADAIRLILEISRKVIAEEVKTNKNLILSMAAQAFKKCALKDEIVLKVSSEDFEYVHENKEELLASSEGIGELEIKRDSALKSGACIVETPFGSLDASIDTKFNLIQEEFIDSLAGNNFEDNLDEDLNE